MNKLTYIVPEMEDISIVSENRLMAASPQNYNLTDYDWSSDSIA